MKEIYPKELIHLIVEYAKKRRELLEIDLLESIKLNTPIYFLIGNYDWNFDENSKYWQELISRYENGENIEELVYSMQLKNYIDKSLELKWFGCFRYKHVIDKNNDEIVKIHFTNNDKSGEGPLSSSQINLRMTELKEMFEEIKKEFPNVKYVQGGSWLYNLKSYTRLFPDSYTKEMKSIKPKPNLLVIWGQFLDSNLKVKDEMKTKFLENIKNANTIDDLDKSFELLELFPKGDIKDFYAFYSINE